MGRVRGGKVEEGEEGQEGQEEQGIGGVRRTSGVWEARWAGTSGGGGAEGRKERMGRGDRSQSS